jgi:hypothetical protein
MWVTSIKRTAHGEVKESSKRTVKEYKENNESTTMSQEQ